MNEGAGIGDPDYPHAGESLAPDILVLRIQAAIGVDQQRGRGDLRQQRGGNRVTDPVTITVTDDGSGIAAADMDRIFEPFFTSRRGTGGTGLGLPIARSLLAASGGDLRMVKATEGASFELRLSRSQ